MSLTMSIRAQRWFSAAIMVVVLLALVLPLDAPTRIFAQSADEPPPAGDVIVVLKDDVSPDAVTSASSAVDDVQPEMVYSYVFDGFSANVTQSEANALADDPRVEAIYPNNTYTEADDQTVPTGIRRVGDDENPSADIDGIDDVRVNADIAILDTGVSANTGDLSLVGGVNCVDDGKSYNFDGTGHGTHVAGIAAALDNGAGVVGIAPGARVWSVRVLDSTGSGSDATLICGLDWVQKRATTIDVVNMSIQGSGTDGDCDSTALHLAICAVVNDANVPVVVAAGNNGANAATTIPATYDQVIAVSNMVDYNGEPGGGASPPSGCSSPQLDDTLSTTSNFGPDVDIAAPGTCILSLNQTGGLVYKSGTSMASPHVAGAVALYKATNPNASPAGVKTWLLSNAKAQDSDEGFTGDPDSSHEPILWLGGGVPTATATPTTAPTSMYKLIRSGASPQSAASTYVRDGKLSTIWTTKVMSSGPPSDAWVWVDMGGRVPVGTIRWVFGQAGIADYFEIEGSNNLETWAFITKRNGHAVGDWQEKTLNNNFRYIRFHFINVKNRTTLGGLAEIQVWAPGLAPPLNATPTATNTPTATATVPPNGNYPLYGSSRSSNSTDPKAVWDGDPLTTWQSDGSPPAPASAYVYVTLGSPKPIGQIRWMYGGDGNIGNDLTIQVSDDKITWTPVYHDTNNSAANVWLSTYLGDVTAKYVRWFYTNPSNVALIGDLSEIEIYAPNGNPTATASPTSTMTTASTLTSTSTGTAADTNTPTETSTVGSGSETDTPTASATPADTSTATDTVTVIPTDTATVTDTPVRHGYADRNGNAGRDRHAHRNLDSGWCV